MGQQCGGLQKFLEIIIELYSTTLSSALKPESASPLRAVTSAMLGGVLDGYGRVDFGNDRGWHILSSYCQQWLHFVPFLRHKELETILNKIEPDGIKSAMTVSVLPIIHSIDNLVSQDQNNYVLPRMGQFVWESRRLEISLEILFKGVSTKRIDIQCYLEVGQLYPNSIAEAVNRGAKLIVAPLGQDLKETCESDDILRHIVVDTSEKDSAEITEKAQAIINYAVSKETSFSSTSAPLTFNFAKDFPLHNPFLAKYFHVYRSSVRELLRSFEHRNGVRLWCSVRRSGKTTACFDLSATSGTSIVVSQSCENTEQIPNASLFYDSVIDALASGKQLPNDYFVKLVLNCGTSKKSDALRYVFVLDEYETLFERLRLAAQRDEELKYTIVRPLLNQMVSFSKNNLLVFIG